MGPPDNSSVSPKRQNKRWIERSSVRSKSEHLCLTCRLVTNTAHTNAHNCTNWENSIVQGGSYTQVKYLLQHQLIKTTEFLPLLIYRPPAPIIRSLSGCILGPLPGAAGAPLFGLDGSPWGGPCEPPKLPGPCCPGGPGGKLPLGGKGGRLPPGGPPLGGNGGGPYGHKP
jgi:hypothetical protein